MKQDSRLCGGDSLENTTREKNPKGYCEEGKLRKKSKSKSFGQRVSRRGKAEKVVRRQELKTVQGRLDSDVTGTVYE